MIPLEFFSWFLTLAHLSTLSIFLTALPLAFELCSCLPHRELLLIEKCIEKNVKVFMAKESRETPYLGLSLGLSLKAMTFSTQRGFLSQLGMWFSSQFLSFLIYNEYMRSVLTIGAEEPKVHLMT